MIRPVKSVQAGSIIFSITYIKDLTVDGVVCQGETSGADEAISLDKDLLKNERLHDKTLFHEWLHALLYVTGQACVMQPQQEEGLVLMLENALYDRCDIKSLTRAKY